MTGRGIRNVLLYVLISTAFLAVASELFLRMIMHSSAGYYVWPPNLRLNFEPSEAATPGVSDTGRFWTNSLGLRADEVPADAQLIVYVFGGSTAIELFLDQNETWSHLIQQQLNNIPGYPRTWVGNLAKSSLATLHNLMHFDYLLPRLPRADLFINLVGVNDLQLALKSSYLRNMTREQHMSWAFSDVPPERFWQRLDLWRLYNRVMEWREKSRTGLVQTHQADGLIAWKHCRQTAPPDKIEDKLPDLTGDLAAYRGNLNALIDRAQVYGSPMIFMTQPSLWKNSLDSEEFSRLLAGGLGPNNEWCIQQRYYSPRALALGIYLYNQTLIDVCNERGIFCIDLASALPKQARYFYDDMHFSEEGARKVAEVAVAGVLKFQKQKVATSLRR